MATLTKTGFETKYNDSSTGQFKDNTTKDITPSRPRTLVTDIKDSVPFTSSDDPYSWAKGNRAGITAPASLKDIVTLTLGFGTQITFTDSTASNVLRTYELTNETTAESSPTIIRPNDYATTTNEKVWRLRATVDVDSDSPGTSIPFGSTSGTNTYTATMSPVVAAYVDGDMYHVRVGNSSTGLVTFDLGPGAKKSFVTSGIQSQSGYFIAGVDYLLVYKASLDSAAGGFQVVNELIHGFMNFRGTYTSGASGLYPSAGGSAPGTAIRHGDAFVMADSDTLGTRLVQIGDLIFTGVDAPGQTESNWYIIPGYNSLALKAPLASPTFTGTPAAPTAAQGTNTTQVATTAYVQTEVALKQTLINAAAVITDASSMDLTAIKHTLTTSSATRTFTISYTGDDITLIVTLNAASSTFTFPATALCISDGYPTGNNTCPLAGVSGDKYLIAIKNVGSDYYVVCKKIGQ